MEKPLVIRATQVTPAIQRCIALVMLTMALNLQTGTAQEPTAPAATPLSGMLRGLNPVNWKMPDFGRMLPGADEKARITKKKDGLFTEVRQTASNSWTRTKEVFNPQKLNPVNFMTASARTPSQPREEEATKPGFFSSLFGTPPAEPAPPETVQDFLKQSRPN